MQFPSFDRRLLLRSASVAVAIPFLESIPVGSDAAEPGKSVLGLQNDGTPRRMVCICNSLGLYLPNFIPKQTGFGYETTRYLKHIDDLRDQYTVLSGVYHPEVDGGHAARKVTLPALLIRADQASRIASR